ncbi:MAG: hypothetical protein PHD48_08830 [Alphaproteobacteria bacterium]|nr:hypothetical protein [Alphaproteobacteria bacterium]
MQITSAPPLPPVSTALSEPQTLAHALPQVLAQAAAPITQNAIAPAPKAERGKKGHRRGDPEHADEERKDEPEKRGDHINLSV